MNKLLIGLMLVLVSGNAIAEWTQIDFNNDFHGGRIVYANLSSIRKNGDMVKLWTMDDFKTAQVNGINQKTYLSNKTLQEYDCKEARVRPLSTVYMSRNSGQGDVVSIYTWPNDPDNWLPVTPDSLGEALLEVACGKQ